MKSKETINKAAMSFIFCIGFIHFMFVKNKAHKGSFTSDDSIHLAGNYWLYPAQAINCFYALYFLYFLLLILKVLKLEGVFKKENK